MIFYRILMNMKRKLLITMMVVASLSSCAGLTQVTVPQSTINFVGQDFETERYVEYTLVKTYILGIGGMSEKARNTNIIDELMKKANLQDNEALAYISVSRNINTFLFVTDVKFTASGYVVRPKGDYDEPEILSAGEREQKQLYNAYNRRINHAITGEDLVKIKKDVDKDASDGKITRGQARELNEKIARLLNN
jgi:polyhydroxyalkanoate synthesis regulator phasin